MEYVDYEHMRNLYRYCAKRAEELTDLISYSAKEQDVKMLELLCAELASMCLKVYNLLESRRS